jgi:two-component system, NarL family, sensor kinase
MWISKYSRLSHAHSELEALILERTAELQRLSQRLLQVQDEERRKIARDLHDTTGQTLAALKISVSFLQEHCKESPTALALVSDVARLADQSIEEIRTMSYLLHPPLLDEVGFACAAEWYIEGFAKRSGITVKAEIVNSRIRLPACRTTTGNPLLRYDRNITTHFREDDSLFILDRLFCSTPDYA